MTDRGSPPPCSGLDLDKCHRMFISSFIEMRIYGEEPHCNAALDQAGRKLREYVSGKRAGKLLIAGFGTRVDARHALATSVDEAKDQW